MKLFAQDLACIRGGRTVFEGLTFTVGAGESLLLTGPNGAGKTSLIRVLAGLVAIASGSVGLDGGDDDHTVGEQCHYVGHLNAIKTAMTVEENIGFWAAMSGVPLSDDGLDAFDLSRHAAIPAALLSAGQRRRLALTRLAVVPRPVWLLDEPTVGLDAASQKSLVDHMHAHLRDDGIIIASSHVDIGLSFDHTLDLAGDSAA